MTERQQGKQSNPSVAAGRIIALVAMAITVCALVKACACGPSCESCGWGQRCESCATGDDGGSNCCSSQGDSAEDDLGNCNADRN